MIVRPIAIGSINGSPVRFFLSPAEDDRPDFPWVAFDDLLIAFDTPPDLCEIYRQDLGKIGGRETCVIPTMTGAIVAVPHYTGNVFVCAMDNVYGLNTEAAYIAAALNAFNVILGQMPGTAQVEYAEAAARRWREGAEHCLKPHT